MRIRVVAVGRARRSPEAELCAVYLKRIHHTWPVELREVEGRGAGRDVAAGESVVLRAATPAGAYVIALDRRGRSVDSVGFADLFARWKAQSIGQLVFLIGGAEGLSEELIEDADVVLSFGSMTWPHMLARVMLVEQIYRAQQILAGNPYHRA